MSSVVDITAADLACLAAGIPLSPLPPPAEPSPELPHAPARQGSRLPAPDKRQAVRNALRYFPAHLHAQLAPEFAAELDRYGHIYMYRFKPRIPLRAYPIQLFPAGSVAGRAIMLMICNNLDPAVAQFPEELVTYGGNGQVFSNWAQFWLAMRYLAQLDEGSTLALHSGHPMGLFPSCGDAPRMIVTNGMMVPNHSSPGDYERLFALGVTQYGQMTAGSFCYIGPQGIVHGTTLTLLNAGRRMLHQAADSSSASAGEESASSSSASSSSSSPLAGRVFVSSGLGGMSGAQAKAAAVCGCVGVIAEVSEEALAKRHRQGWLDERVDSLDELVELVRRRRAERRGVSIGYYGNVVDVWERLVEVHMSTGELLADLGSDQTSCHNPFLGGYYPVGIGYEEARQMMDAEPEQFRGLVEASLRRQVEAINYLHAQGMYFFDYGNAFLLQASRAGADVLAADGAGCGGVGGGPPRFRYPSYVQDIMGDIFSLGFGPFRWVCTSGLPQDLALTDELAGRLLDRLGAEPGLPQAVRQQYADNRRWIGEAAGHRLVVGSQARILYSDLRGRTQLAAEFNAAVADGRLAGPVVLSRDHHDVSGTDSPYRETSNIADGSAVCADMAVHNVLGDACRGATWVALHNGGGTGWGEAVNGGFGLVLDGSQSADEAARRVLHWDVANGVARRCWAGHPLARLAAERAQAECPELRVTMPTVAEDALIDGLF